LLSGIDNDMNNGCYLNLHEHRLVRGVVVLNVSILIHVCMNIIHKLRLLRLLQ
jgi:hypothetical protein